MNTDTSQILVKFLTCPITGFGFYNPVTAADGNTYEMSALDTWFKNNNTSPITGEKIDKVVYRNTIVKQLVTELKTVYDIPTYTPSETDFDNEINEFIHSNNFSKILQYKKFNLSSLMGINIYGINFIEYLVKTFTDNNIINHIIQHCDNLDASDSYGNKIIHYLCMYPNIDTLRLIFEKNILINSPNNNNDYPIHFMCKNLDHTIVKMLIDYGALLTVTNNDGMQPLHIACKYSSAKVVKLLIKNEVNVNYFANNGTTPLELARSNSKIVKLLKDNGAIDFNAEPDSDSE